MTSATIAASAAVKAVQAQTQLIPIIDTHIHLFDQTRPQGAPYTGNPGNTQPALPSTYRQQAPPGIVGAIEIEASPWIEDNLWVADVEQPDTTMVGYIGNLQPDKPEFAEYLDRFHRNKLFLGIRYGNLWARPTGGGTTVTDNLAQQVSNPTFISGLKLLQQADLTLDTANPNPDLIQAVIAATDLVPGLRVVVDHLPAMLRSLGPSGIPTVDANLHTLAARPNVYVKVSSVLVLDAAGKPVTDPSVYRPSLDYIFQTFGEDKIIFGSDWPNSIAATNLPSIVKIVQDYFYGKGVTVAEKYFWRNSVKAYKWVQREYSQPQP